MKMLTECGFKVLTLSTCARIYTPSSGDGYCAQEHGAQLCSGRAAVQVEETLKPKALAMGNGLTWEGMLGDLQPKQPWPSTAKLTAYALYDGTMTNDKSGEVLA